jgi:hypothetical protein
MVLVATFASVGASGSHAAIVHAAGVSEVFLESDPGEYRLEGGHRMYTSENSDFHIVSGTDTSTFIQLYATDDVWMFSFGPASGSVLTMGTYQVNPLLGDASPSMSANPGGLVCTYYTGWFRINEYAHDAGGTVSALSVDFQSICSQDGTSLFGQIRYQAASGISALTIDPSSADLGSAIIGNANGPTAVTVSSVGDEPVALSSIGITGPGAADYELGGTCSVGPLAGGTSCTADIQFKPTAEGNRAAQLAIDDDTLRGSHTASLTGLGRLFDWGNTTAAGPSYTWNYGHALARTTGALHALVATDRIGSRWASDTGPYVGISYLRSTNGGATWATPRRLNPTSQHGDRSAIAASGSYVYATWVRLTKWIHYAPKAPRIVYLRVSTNQGSTWGTITRLTPTTGRVDLPTVAASGASVYVAYTDSSTGSIKLAISHNHGSTWKTISVGTTTGTTTDGRTGYPVVAASGTHVAVAWFATAHTLKARVSTTSASSFGSTFTLGTTGLRPAVAALGGRIAVAWAYSGSLRVRTWAGSWSAVRVVPTANGITQTGPADVAIALNGVARVGLAWSSANQNGFDTEAGLYWRSSTTNGTSWLPTDSIAGSAESVARKHNDTPSIDWSVTGAPIVVFEGWTDGTNNYRLYLRTAQ